MKYGIWTNFYGDLSLEDALSKISDNDGTGDQHLSPMRGTINWQEFIKAIKAVKSIEYDGLLDLEIPRENTLKHNCKRQQT